MKDKIANIVVTKLRVLVREKQSSLSPVTKNKCFIAFSAKQMLPLLLPFVTEQFLSLGWLYGATTLSATTLSITTLSIMTLSITTLSIPTLSIMTLSLTTFSIIFG
jgi:hypothetical protein